MLNYGLTHHKLQQKLFRRIYYQHIKNLEKPRRANTIFFLEKSKMAVKNMMNLLSYKAIYCRPNSSRNVQMAAMKTLVDHLIFPINAMMTTYVSSS